MNNLILNRGSSSIKCCLFEFSSLPDRYIPPVWEEKIEWKNVWNKGSIQGQLEKLLSDKKIDCIGHRIVHGGEKYKESIRIDSDVKSEIKKLADLAPLHNLADLEGIEVLEQLFPEIPQIAVFDTAFHHTLPPAAYTYPGPYQWLEEGIRRYGFHGTSFQYCTKAAGAMLGTLPPKMVICHLGSGASLSAVENGKSVDTTMGFTPLEGLMMDTRSGTIDPGILLSLLKSKSVDALSKELYEQSGLLGLSGVSSDMRDILEKAAHGHPRAQLALDVYCHRLISLIGAMIGSLGGIDVLVFTGGIGENAPSIRERVCSHFSFLGIQLAGSHKKSANDRILSSSDSKVQVLLIQTQEAFEIARECWLKMLQA